VNLDQNQFYLLFPQTQSYLNYRRHDEIGTPLCITVDFETLENKSVTIRDRDSMQQKRLSLEELKNYYEKYFE
jgi:glycyl-tRNA synthetase